MRGKGRRFGHLGAAAACALLMAGGCSDASDLGRDGGLVDGGLDARGPADSGTDVGPEDDGGKAPDARAAQDAGEAPDAGGLADAGRESDGSVLGDAGAAPDASICAPGACDDDNECTVDSCDPETGCANEAAPNGAPCAGGTCQGGQCALGCTADAECDDQILCTEDSCDITTGLCVRTPRDWLCSDGNVCNGTETCDLYAGCEAGLALDCNDGNACTEDSCDPTDGCMNVALEDGTGCTLPAGKAATCQGGDCTGCTSDADCDDGFDCTTDSCDLDTQVCAHTTDDAICDDGNVCNGTESCLVGRGCEPGLPLECADRDSCTVDSCDPVMGCEYPPLDCDDGDACTKDQCFLGRCLHYDRTCSDGDACTIDGCDSSEGCTYSPRDCDDKNDCTMDSCDPLTGCVHAPVADGLSCTADDGERALLCKDGQCIGCDGDVSCDDGLVCNGLETCDLTTGTCQDGEPLDCDDGNPCTRDRCGTSGCVHLDDDNPCDDGDMCNGLETCDPELGCQPGTPVDCDDGVACTFDECDPATGMCANIADDTACDDSNECTIDTCDPVTGCIHDEAAADGTVCTLPGGSDGTCESGTCI